jgi:hypothetical protein
MPDKEGEVIQSLVNNEGTCMMDGKAIVDEKVIGGTNFLRRANYFWFTMNFKLGNPGTNHEYIGSEKIGAIDYHKVKVSYVSEVTGKEQNDGYIIFINPETYLVDQFLFSLPAMGVNDIAIKMVVEYEAINGLKLPTKRTVYMPEKDGKLATEPSLIQTSTNVKFNNDFTLGALKG